MRAASSSPLSPGLIVLVGGLAAGCAMKTAVLPVDVQVDAARLPIQYRFASTHASLDGLRIVDVRQVARPPVDREMPLQRRKRWLRFGLADDAGLRWLALCSIGRNNRTAPATSLVCTYEAETETDAPMSLVLVGTSTGAWSGSFFADDRRYELVGTDEVNMPLQRLHVGSAGLRILEDGRRLGFVELLADDMIQGWMLPEVEVSTRRRLGPLYLTFAVAADPRSREDEDDHPQPEREPLINLTKPVGPLMMPPPTDDPRFGPHVDRLASLGLREEQAALLAHVPAHHDLDALEPQPRAGPDLRPDRKTVSFDLMFPSLSFNAPVSTTVGQTPAAPFGWSLAGGLYLGTTIADFAHFGALAEFGGVRPDTGPADETVGLTESSMSTSWRFAAGARLTVVRLGKLRPYVGGEFVAAHWFADFANIEDLGTSAWGVGGAPVVGTRWVLQDRGRYQAELIFEARVDFVDWYDPQRSDLADALTTPEVRAWLEQVEATQQSIAVGGLVGLLVRL